MKQMAIIAPQRYSPSQLRLLIGCFVAYTCAYVGRQISI
jgi:hypothetical protein